MLMWYRIIVYIVLGLIALGTTGVKNLEEKMAFVGVEMTEEDKRLVNSWPEEARKLGREFLDRWIPFGYSLTDRTSVMAVDQERGFYFICNDIENRGSDGPVINPTYFFYLWWDGGFIEICAKEEEKRREVKIDNKIRYKLYYLKYDVFDMYLYQKKAFYTKEFLFNIVKEAFDVYKSNGDDPYYDSYIETLVVNLNDVKLSGDWSK